MMSIFDDTDMPEVAEPRAGIGGIGIGIDRRPSRRWSWHYHPFPARNLGLEKAISEYGNHGDRIEDEDQQHHCVGEVDVQLAIGDRDHQLEADPVEQRQGQVELGIPWTPEPICSTRRRRPRGCLVNLIRFGNFLHVQSLSAMKNSTDHDRAKPPVALARSDAATPFRDFPRPAFLSPLLAGPWPVRIPGRLAGRGDARP